MASHPGAAEGTVLQAQDRLAQARFQQTHLLCEPRGAKLTLLDYHQSGRWAAPEQYYRNRPSS